MSVSDEREPVVEATSGDGTFSFSVTGLELTADPGLSLSDAQTDEDPDDATWALMPNGVQFSATVAIAGPPAPGRWQVGWIQTVWPCGQSVTYQLGPWRLGHAFCQQLPQNGSRPSWSAGPDGSGAGC